MPIGKTNPLISTINRGVDNIKFATNGVIRNLTDPTTQRRNRFAKELSQADLLGGQLSHNGKFTKIEAVKPKNNQGWALKNFIVATLAGASIAQARTHFVTDWSSNHLSRLSDLPTTELSSRGIDEQAIDILAKGIKKSDNFINYLGDRGYLDVPLIDVPFISSPFKNRDFWPFHMYTSAVALIFGSLGAAKRNLDKTSIRPGELLKGFQNPGRGVKLGVVDETSAKAGKASDLKSKSFQLTGNIPPTIKVILPDGDDFYARKIPVVADPDHGTRVSDIFAGGAFSATEMVFVKPNISKEDYKALREFFELGEKDPSSMTLKRLNEVSKPIFKLLRMVSEKQLTKELKTLMYL
ncbi:MAG: hypothetical protein SFU25_07350 [Candidatus Caenarcaniphilales bacterium]|nr:hypothetical protein [Candidatus Caenarcaniphilales bacterium]